MHSLITKCVNYHQEIKYYPQPTQARHGLLSDDNPLSFLELTTIPTFVIFVLTTKKTVHFMFIGYALLPPAL